MGVSSSAMTNDHTMSVNPREIRPEKLNIRYNDTKRVIYLLLILIIHYEWYLGDS